MRRSAATIPLLALAAGCASEPSGPAKPPAPPPAIDLGTAFVSPARWDYHPAAPGGALSMLRLPDGRCLFTAEGGQRWMTSSTKGADVDAGAKGAAPKGCEGRAEASGAIAQEELVGIVQRSDASWIFVGDSGTLYEASDPLGPFGRTVPAPEPFARVAGAGGVVLGATYEGRVMRWEEATGWRAVAAPPGGAPPRPGAPPLARVLDLAVGDEGRALALAFPEALFTSTDGGASWAAAGTPTVGARALGRTARGDLAVEGLAESLVWRPRESVAFARTKDAIQGPSASLDVEVARAPSSAAVLSGRAAMDGDRYYEMIRPDGDRDEWRLARGRIEGRLEIVPVPKSAGCAGLRFGARGASLVAACVTGSGGDLAVEVRRSADAGSTWGAPLKLPTPDGDQVNVAVSPEGAALVTGVCRPVHGGVASDPTPGAPTRADGAVGGCKPNAPLVLRPEGDGLRAEIAGAPQLSGLALLPAFSADGRSAYFLGRRGKDDRINLFVSRDAGATFAPRALDTSAIARPAPRPRAEDPDDEPREPEGPDTFEVDDSSSLHPGDDGSLGLLLLRSRGGYAYVTTDDDGRVTQVASPPSDEAIMAGFGRRVVAIAANPDGSGSSVWESSDGGGAWDTQPGPLVLSREFYRSTPAIACSMAGCLVGDTLTRAGWGLAGDAGPAERTPEPPPSGPGTLTPITCELSSSTKWTRVDHLFNPGSSYAAPLPDVGVVMRRRSVWSVITLNRENGAVVAYSANLPESGEGEAKVAAQTLLAPHGQGQRVAIAISRQAEGYAALRAPLTLDKGQLKPGTPMRNVDVTWENYMTGASVRAKIPDAGVFEKDDAYLGAFDALNAGFVSVSTGGIVVRPHMGGRAAYFIDTAGRVERLELPTYPSRGLSGGELNLHADSAIVDGAVIGTGQVRDRNGSTTSLFLAHRPLRGGKPESRWETIAAALAPPRLESGPLLFSTDWSYIGKGAIGLTALFADAGHGRAWAYFLGMRPDGTLAAPVPAATLLDAGDRPRPCSAAERAATPRLEARLFLNGAGGPVLFPGQRHPVLVHEPPAKNAVGVTEPIVLLTAGAVTHGPPGSPCVAGWEAKGLRNSGFAAVIPGDLGRAWIFRIVSDTPQPPSRRPRYSASGNYALEYRPMACKYDPGAFVPEAVWNEPGTSKIDH